jgi:hypothetical protein
MCFLEKWPKTAKKSFRTLQDPSGPFVFGQKIERVIYVFDSFLSFGVTLVTHVTHLHI